MSTPTEQLGAIVDRLEQAAARLKTNADPPPSEPQVPRAPPTDRRRLGEVLDGLDRANVEVRRARARLTELEARLGRPRAA